MKTLQESLKKIKQKPIGLMTHVVIGYPTLADTKRIVKTMEQKGADVIELQIPFSDPLADGPTIMKACEKALENGTKVIDSFKIMKELSQDVSIPLLFMCYYNTVFHFGTEKFIKMAKEVGCSGLIVPDMPLEEESYEHFYAYCKTYGMPVIFVVSPATTNERLEFIAKHAIGFVYATAHQGITGAKQELDSATVTFLERVRKFFSIPVAVGFGISNKEQINALKTHADIAIVGSALINAINKSEDIVKGAGDFVQSLVIE